MDFSDWVRLMVGGEQMTRLESSLLEPWACEVLVVVGVVTLRFLSLLLEALTRLVKGGCRWLMMYWWEEEWNNDGVWCLRVLRRMIFLWWFCLMLCRIGLNLRCRLDVMSWLLREWKESMLFLSVVMSRWRHISMSFRRWSKMRELASFNIPVISLCREAWSSALCAIWNLKRRPVGIILFSMHWLRNDFLSLVFSTLRNRFLIASDDMVKTGAGGPVKNSCCKTGKRRMGSSLCWVRSPHRRVNRMNGSYRKKGGLTLVSVRHLYLFKFSA